MLTYTSTVSVVDNKFESGLFVYDSTKGAPLYDARDYEALTAELKSQVDTVEAQLRDGSIKLTCR